MQGGFCLTDLLGHYINTDELPGVLSVGLGPVVGEVPLPDTHCTHGPASLFMVCQSLQGDVYHMYHFRRRTYI